MDGAQPVLPRSGRFNRAPLVQLLADLGIAQAGPQPLSFAQRFGPWLAWTDAIVLSAVLGTGPQPAGARGPVPLAALPVAANLLIDEAWRLRQDLAQAIGSDPALGPPTAIEGPLPDADAGAALRRQHRLHQRTMDERIAALRTRLRAVMASVSPALAHLAALDAVLGPSLQARQRQLLAAVPAWLGRGGPQRSVPAQPGGAPAAGPALVQAALLAELDLRWQPIAGLIGALHEAAGGPP